jgi:hypothetical protein
MKYDDIHHIDTRAGVLMATATSTGVYLSSDFFLKNFYKFNRNAYKASTRTDYNKTELSYEDSRALKRAVSKLASYTYEEGENGDNLVNSVYAFVKTYNNTIESTSGKDSDSYRQSKQLKALTEKYGKDLKEIGISVKDDGTLSVSDKILKGSSFKEIGKVFSKESSYMNSIRHISKRINDTSYDGVYAEMTGAGGRLNIIL